MKKLALVALFAIGLACAEPLTLTLDQATRYALDHSRVLQQGQVDIDKAATGIDQAMSAYYPSAAIQGSFAYLSNVGVLSLPLGPGGSYITIPLGSHANYDAKLSVSQVLYSGGRVSSGYKAALLGRNMAQQNVARTRQQLIYDVRRQFDDVLLTQELLGVTREALTRAQDHLKQVIALREQGYVSQYDSLRTAVQVSNLTPQIARLEAGIALLLDAFKLTLGMPPQQEIVLDGRLEPASFDVDEPNAIEQAMANRIELKLLDSTLRLTQLTKRITEGVFYPSVVAAGSYDLQNPSSLGATGFGPAMTLSLGLSYTLFDGLKTRAQLRQADLDMRKIRLGRDLARDGIVLEVREAVTSMKTAKIALGCAQCNVDAAQQGVKLAEARYQEGQGSNLDVLDAQLALLQAQVNVLTSIRDYDQAHARLVKAIGKEE